MHGIRGADRDDMLVNMIPVHVVEMAIMKIINMPVMANRRVPAVRAMLVGMVGMVLLCAGDHEIPLPLVCDRASLFFGGTSYRAGVSPTPRSSDSTSMRAHHKARHHVKSEQCRRYSGRQDRGRFRFLL